MSRLTTHKVKIAGMSACVPKTIEENLSLPIFASEEEARKVIVCFMSARQEITLLLRHLVSFRTGLVLGRIVLLWICLWAVLAGCMA